MGPALAPIIAGFSVGVEGWHWYVPELSWLHNAGNFSFGFAWELLWPSGPVCFVMLFSLPETSAANILLRRARRLRLLTGRDNLKSQSEIDQANMISGAIAFDALIKPWQINLLDPAVVCLLYPSLKPIPANWKLDRLSQRYTQPSFTASSTPSNPSP